MVSDSAKHIIFDFKKGKDVSGWEIENDSVMGGLSKGHFALDADGHAHFQGHVSLENNGGFSMLQHRFESVDVSAYSQFVVRLKGDGKKYQFRAKSRSSDKQSYVHRFETSGEWQTVSIPFDILSPTFRGNSLDMPNYEGLQLEGVAFLIGNKKEENFNLLIDFVGLK